MGEIIKVNFKEKKDPLIEQISKLKENLDNGQLYGGMLIQETYDGEIDMAYIVSPDEDLSYVEELLEMALETIRSHNPGEYDESERPTEIH